MRYVPNILSILRIMLSLILLVIKPFTLYFNVIYILTCISDFLDGYIARKTNTTTSFGAKLDSVADIAFISIIFIIMIPNVTLSSIMIKWIFIILLIRIVSLLIVIYKYSCFAILHTYANKASGLLLYVFPLLYKIININALISVICIIASLAAIEELCINLLSKKLNLNKKSIIST